MDSLQVRALASGSSGNCYLIKTEKTKILVDAGLTCKAITDRLRFCGEDPHEIHGVLITHEHIDHIKGVPVLSRKLNVKIYANAQTWVGINPEAQNIGLQSQRHFVTGQGFEIGDLWIEAFSTSHDSRESVGFVFHHTATGIKVGLATDLGEVTPVVAGALKNCHLLVAETNHDLEMLWKGSYPWPLKKRVAGNRGHLSNQAGAALIRDAIGANTRAVWLAHLSKENNRPQIAYGEVSRTLFEGGIQPEKDVMISVVPRETIGPLFEEKR